MKTQLIHFLISALLMLGCMGQGWAQNKDTEDVIYLENGSVIRGRDHRT